MKLNTKHIKHQLVDCAMSVAMYSVPGFMEADQDSKEAYKALAADVLFLQPKKSLKRLIPFRREIITAGKKHKELNSNPV
ncbi:hypothetical protein [Pedobacter metabolipauper]|uniref:Uncharacterized protein n=1 Tax=Pedobacter metabolipauper TaxID=425513 RepID=A0A4R6SQ73_9SPHI|nr:hypothetical protein [Pedobacter metabolipauper]TDQ06214.1 hypothetical protein ATK78_4595 [Pedobacter metabolipauper]